MPLKFIEKRVFSLSLNSTWFFRNVVRNAAYAKAKGDPEKVHELAMETLNEYYDVLEKKASKFDFPELHVKLGKHDIMPFGTAAGLDKNGDVLIPLSKLFGFLEPGTVVINPRDGNPRPRVAVDKSSDNLYNAQGFPHKGLEYFLNNIKKYQASGSKTPVFVSICGLPQAPDKIGDAFDELKTLLEKLNPYVDGFVWNPFSPNTAALAALRTPEMFKKTAQLVTKIAGKDKLKLVKLGPYDDNEEKRLGWLKLASSWLDGGGDGLVAVNTYMVSKEQVPIPTWGYPTAGRSGTFLQSYRRRAIKDARSSFPKAIIIAAGGIDSAEEAWQCFEAGANAVEGYSPYTFKGFALILEMAKGLKKKLQSKGYRTLQEYQKERLGIE